MGRIFTGYKRETGEGWHDCRPCPVACWAITDEVAQLFKVIVDADACPRACLLLLQKYQKTWHYRLLTIASVDHRVDHGDHVVVGKGRDAADLAVINHTARGDIVVTQDWGLAALVLGKGAHALSPSGRIYSDENIDFLLEERFVKAKHRRAGGRTKGPAARTDEDNRRFEQSLINLLERAAQGGSCSR